MEVAETTLRLVAELARDLGLEDLEFDGDGKVVFEIDNGFLLSLIAIPERPALIVHAPIASDAISFPSLMRAALEGNFHWQAAAGGALAMDPENGALVLHAQLDTQAMPFPQFSAFLDQFVEAVTAWRAKAETEVRNSADADDGPSETLYQSLV